MTYRFDGDQGLIVVDARLDGPVGQAYLVLALDTGATSTLINVDRLVSLGYDPALRKSVLASQPEVEWSMSPA